MAFVVNVEESQHNPAVEHIDEQGLPPAIRHQFGVPTAAPQSEAHLDDSSRRLVGIVADGLCLYYCILASEDLTSWTLTHDSATGIAHDREVGDRDLSNAK